MPVTRDISSITTTDHSHRVLILFDEESNYFVWGKFDYPYDTSASIDGVTQLFDVSLAMLRAEPNSTGMVDLPILKHLGRWKVTLVTRNHAGVVTISDALKVPVDSYMGFET